MSLEIIYFNTMTFVLERTQVFLHLLRCILFVYFKEEEWRTVNCCPCRSCIKKTVFETDQSTKGNKDINLSTLSKTD